MKKFLFAILYSGCILSFPALPSAGEERNLKSADRSSPDNLESGIVIFTPPKGWFLADSNLLPARVKIMVVGKGPSSFPPSMNLSMEPYKGSLKQYLKTVKNMNEAQGYDWKDLGTIKTEAGNASLSQVDTKTEWGTVRLMHVILMKSGTIYILTASALKDEFSQFYKDFFAAMRSLRIAKNAFEMVISPQQKAQLKGAKQKLETQWQTFVSQKQMESPSISIDDIKEQVFQEESFQNAAWKPFKELITQKYADMGEEWQKLALQKAEDDLFEVHIN